MRRAYLLDRHIQGRLTPKEQAEFDRLLETDATFRDEVSFAEDVQKVAEVEADANFLSMLKEFEKEEPIDEEKPVIKLPRYRWMAIAASFVILLGLSIYFVLNAETSPEDLFAEHFEPYRNVVHPITRGKPAEDEKTQAFLAYQNEEYDNAITLFDKLYEQEGQPYYLFYKANALLELNSNDEAIAILQKSDQLGEFADRSAWYLALAYLKVEDTEKAKEHLQQIVGAQKYNHVKAAELLQQLD